MIELITTLPIWQIIRSSGIASYILLAVGICLGILYSFPFFKGKNKVRLHKMHTFSTISGTGIGMLHGMITVIDQYTAFNWSEVLIPFTAVRAPVLNGLGTLSVYGMLLLIFTSDIRHKLQKKVWLLIHMLSYPIFIMAFIHGYFLGTDSNLSGIRWVYFGSITLVISLTALRAALVPTSSRFKSSKLKSTVQRDF
ncbi:ferric reductase [Paenibacillus psychroresistens]|uniref:ferric reductase n=1 Tax=Paenibacillus psychroresistens TaxID=1778678 RepID=UPI0018781DBC|nr:ferric reductase [Paenibacillus psychroresistens]